MVIFMADYRAKKMTQGAAVKTGGYDAEVLDANWNWAVIHMFRDVAPCAPSPQLPEDLSTLDVKEFLGKVYVLAGQI